MQCCLLSNYIQLTKKILPKIYVIYVICCCMHVIITTTKLMITIRCCRGITVKKHMCIWMKNNEETNII